MSQPDLFELFAGMFGDEPIEPRPAGEGARTFGERGRSLNERLEEAVVNQMWSRAEMMRKMVDPRRDIGAECGHPSGPVTAPEYDDMCRTFSIANRANEVWSSECWKVTPTVYEDEDADEVTPFERGVDGLARQLRGGMSFYQDEAGSPVWDVLRRADEQSTKGRFGVILFGVDDGKNDLSLPAEFVVAEGLKAEAPPRRKARPPARPTPALPPAANQDEPPERPEPASANLRPLKFLQVYAESTVTVKELDNDQGSSRFGQPALYTITMADPSRSDDAREVDVHWTRVLHVSLNVKTSEVYSQPSGEAVWTHFLDLKKLYGGSAEMYWRAAFMGLALETNPQLGARPKIDADKLKDRVEKYQHGLQRFLLLTGMSAKALAPQVVDPTPQINAHLEAVCVEKNIPMRIFKGSERGNQASEQDDDNWEGRVHGRRTGLLTPRLVIPFFDRLIHLGCLPAPNGFSVEWPERKKDDMLLKAQVAKLLVEALAKYVESGAEIVFPPLDLLTRLFGLDEEEAQSVLDRAEEIAAEREEEELRQAQEAAEEAARLAAQNPPPPDGGGTAPGGTNPPPPAFTRPPSFPQGGGRRPGRPAFPKNGG